LADFNRWSLTSAFDQRSPSEPVFDLDQSERLFVREGGAWGNQEAKMLKMVGATAIVLFIAASPMAYAQAPSGGAPERLSAADMEALMNARITIVKSTLQLTPDQEQYWTAIENAMRQRANNRQDRLLQQANKRQDRLANAGQTVGEARESPVEAMRDRDPIALMHQRASALAQRATDLDKLADAWQPLYQTLTPDQKKRMGFLALYVLRAMRTGADDRRLLSQDSERD
jgi:hypothetical protein